MGSNVVKVARVGKLFVKIIDHETLGRIFEIEAQNEFVDEVQHEVFSVSGDFVRLRVTKDTMTKLAELSDNLDVPFVKTGEA